MPNDAQLRDVVESILAEYPGARAGIAVFNLVDDSWLEHRAEDEFHAASTMKIAVMIEVYRQAEEGAFAMGDSLVIQTTFRSIVDGEPFEMTVADDSDDAIYESIGEAMSIEDLVFAMITVSSNLATNILIDRVGAENVQRTIERLGTNRMRVLRGVQDIRAHEAGLNNTATARDLALLLRALARREAVSPAADSAMVEVLLHQQFDEMIPAGVPAGTQVAHKTGNITRIHHDAAIVYPDRRPPYILVILTEGIEDRDTSAEMGARLTNAIDGILTREEDGMEPEGP